MAADGEAAALRPVTLEDELRRNSEMRPEDVAQLREWADKQPHLPRVLDRELALFLHSCHYSLEAAKSAADTYFTARTHLPEFFAHRDAALSDVAAAAAVTGFITLPMATPEGYKIMLFRPVDTDPSKFNHADVQKVFLMVADLWLLEGTAPGHVIVFDMTGLSLAHLTSLSLVIFKKFFFYLQEALPFRLNGLHFVNVVPFMDKMMVMMKPFIKKEISDVVHVHAEGLRALFAHVPQEVLPSDYGGAAPPFSELHGRTVARLLANREYFAAEELRLVDEARRLGRPRAVCDLFGVEGSFKKLDID